MSDLCEIVAAEGLLDEGLLAAAAAASSRMVSPSVGSAMATRRTLGPLRGVSSTSGTT